MSTVSDMDYTRRFSLEFDRSDEIKVILTSVYQALLEKGYNPINQIVGYILFPAGPDRPR